MTPFTPADQLDLKPITAANGTPHCQSIVMAVDYVAKARKLLTAEFAREVRIAWIFDFSDGGTMDMGHFDDAVKASKVTALKERIHIFYFGIGDGCDEEYLRKLAQPGRPPVHVRNVESFQRFFEWLQQSLHVYSCSRPGARVQLPAFDDEHPGLITEG
jgi:uncharacterized protein YegL